MIRHYPSFVNDPLLQTHYICLCLNIILFVLEAVLDVQFATDQYQRPVILVKHDLLSQFVRFQKRYHFNIVSHHLLGLRYQHVSESLIQSSCSPHLQICQEMLLSLKFKCPLSPPGPRSRTEFLILSRAWRLRSERSARSSGTQSQGWAGCTG